MNRLAYQLYRLGWSGLDWLFPPNCGGCGVRGDRWCPACQAGVQRILPPICPICGRSQAGEGVCAACQQARPRYQALRSWGVFSGSLQKALHRLKYRGDIALGEALARPLVLLAHEQEWEVDLVTPVPVSLARRAQRGYNQAALLARPIALGCGWAYRSQALKKVRDTHTQVGLTRTQRWENVSGAFSAAPELVEGRKVLVVDDVTTSGATLDACAGALLEAGASAVFGITLARALL